MSFPGYLSYDGKATIDRVLTWKGIAMSPTDLIASYLSGPNQLREAIAGMTPEQINATPIPGKWSTRQVICHLADFEPVYADRMKRVIAEDNPPLRGGDPDVFAAKLAYDKRDIQEELNPSKPSASTRPGF
jgi:hypothetical protein